jgi:hypothetical protein
MRGISWLAGNRLASQEGLSSWSKLLLLLNSETCSLTTLEVSLSVMAQFSWIQISPTFSGVFVRIREKSTWCWNAFTVTMSRRTEVNAATIFQVPPEGINIFTSCVIVILSSRNLLYDLSCFKPLDSLRHSVAPFRKRALSLTSKQKTQVTTCGNNPDVTQLFAQQHATWETIYHPVLYVSRKWCKSCRSGIAATSKDYGIPQFVVWM